MLFKRPRLRPGRPLVNAALASVVIFLGACSGERDAPDAPAADNQVPDAPATSTEGIELPAVWSTVPLAGPITNLAFAGGAGPVLAVALEGGKVQLFDLNGDALSDPVDFGIRQIASGETVRLQDTLLTLFPALGTDGSVSLLAYAPSLDAPALLPLLPTANAAGLCAGAPLDPDDLMQIAYWTPVAPERLIHLAVVENAGNLSVAPATEPVDNETAPIAACALGLDITTARRNTISAIARIGELSAEIDLALNLDGLVTARSLDGTVDAITFRDGLTVRAPAVTTAIAALSDVRFGGYPDGVIVIGGEVADGEHRITFVEPGPLFSDLN